MFLLVSSSICLITIVVIFFYIGTKGGGWVIASLLTIGLCAYLLFLVALFRYGGLTIGEAAIPAIWATIVTGAVLLLAGILYKRNLKERENKSELNKGSNR